MSPGDIAAHHAWLDGRTPVRHPPIGGLRPEQTEAASILANRMEHWRAAVLADPVGSGKSFTAMGVAALLGGRATIVCPATLVGQWRRLLDQRGSTAELVSDGLLSRREVSSEAEGPVIVDEGHRFRNRQTLRRSRLVALVGLRRVLWLTATPVWNTRRDLLSLLRVNVGPVVFADAVGLSLEEADEQIDQCDDLWQAVCARFVLRRSGAGARGRCERSVRAGVVPAEVVDTVVSAAPRAMVLSGEPQVLFGRSVTRRLASSSEAAAATLERACGFLRELDRAQRAGGTLSRAEFRSAFSLDVGLPTQAAFPFWYASGLPLVPDIEERMAIVGRAVEALREHPLEGSEKARVLLRVVRADNPTLVFTEFRATAAAVWRTLPASASAVLLTGDGAEVRGVGRVAAEVGLRAFREGLPGLSLQSHVLVATPVAAEGLNLERAGRVVHFDLPWNDARLEQRVGRADRIGGEGTVEVVTFRPPASVEALCELQGVVARKRRLAEIPDSTRIEPTRAEPSAGGSTITASYALSFDDGWRLLVGPRTLVGVSPSSTRCAAAGLVMRLLTGERVRVEPWVSSGPPLSGVPASCLVLIRALERCGDRAGARAWIAFVHHALGEGGEGGREALRSADSSRMALARPGCAWDISPRTDGRVSAGK